MLRPFIKQFVLIAAIVLNVGLLNAQELKDGAWKVQYHKMGLAISYADIPITWESALHVIKPDWQGSLFYQGREGFTKKLVEKDGRSIFVISEKNDFYESTYEISVVDKDTLRVVYDGELLKDVPAWTEICMGYFNANLITDCAFEAETINGLKKGRTAVFPETDDQVACDIAPGFKKLSFDSVIGKIEISLESNYLGGSRFFDTRAGSQAWVKNNPIFWMGIGVPAKVISIDKPTHVEMLITIDADERIFASRDKTLQITPELELVDYDALDTHLNDLVLIPQPVKADISSTLVAINNNIEVKIAQPANEYRLEKALKKIVNDKVSDHSFKIQTSTSTDGVCTIAIDWDTSLDGIDIQAISKTKWFSNKEGYQLTVNDSGVKIVSSTPQGAFYGLQTLRQLFAVNDGRLFVRHAFVEDWPSLEARGGLWFACKSGAETYNKIIEDVLAAHKMNFAIIQVDRAEKDKYPELAIPESISKEALRKTVQICRDNFIEPVPLISSPGHAEWLFFNKQNDDICEYVPKRYAVCVRNPKSFEVIKTVFEEIIEIFEPTAIHIGGDEVTIRGGFPSDDCERCRGVKSSVLMAEHMNRLIHWLEAKNIKPMVWGDMMLYHSTSGVSASYADTDEDARYLKEQMPRSATVVDWHYDYSGRYGSIDMFQSLGHEVIGCSWSEPLNIYLFSNAAKQSGIKGMVQATWCGYHPNEETIIPQIHQYAGLITAADCYWADHKQTPLEFGYFADQVFKQSFYGEKHHKPRAYTLNLGPLHVSSRSDISSHANKQGLTNLPDTKGYYGNYVFDTKGQGIAHISTNPLSPVTVPAAIEVNLNQNNIEVIQLLNAGVYRVAPNKPLVDVTLLYEDGTTHNVKLINRKNTGCLDGGMPLGYSEKGWQQVEDGRHEVCLWVTEIKNPHPDKLVKTVRFQPSTNTNEWVLAGMTVVER